MATITNVSQQILVERYRNTLYRFKAFHQSLARLVAEDFPNESGEGVTRYHVDALNDLTARLSALVDGYEGRN